MIEEWRDIEGYEGTYQVSNLGKVKSLDRVVLYSNGQSRKYKERILKGDKDKDGYIQYGLHKEGVTAKRKEHRLVGSAFIPNPNNLPQINHISGVKDQNNVENLEWCDALHNSKHGYTLGLFDNNLGEKNPNTHLLDQEVKEIKKALDCPYRGIQSRLAEKYGVTPTTISNIKTGRRWSHLKHVTID